MLTDEEKKLLSEWEELERNATAAPWIIDGCGIDGNGFSIFSCGEYAPNNPRKDPDWLFTVAARTALPRAIEIIRRLEGELAETKKIRDAFFVYVDSELRKQIAEMIEAAQEEHEPNG